MINVEYANAYREVLEIIKYISKEDYEKIPKEKIKLFETCANTEYDFSYNPSKTLDEQHVLKITKGIIAILFRDYWATKTQRERIIAKQNYDKRIIEEKKKEKYNSDIIFRNNNKKYTNDKIENTQEQALIPINNMKWYKKIWGFLKRIYNKKNR